MEQAAYIAFSAFAQLLDGYSESVRLAESMKDEVIIKGIKGRGCFSGKVVSCSRQDNWLKSLLKIHEMTRHRGCKRWGERERELLQLVRIAAR